MNKIWLNLLLFSQAFGVPYFVDAIFPLNQDDELVALWDSLECLHDPTASDYHKIQHYLQCGQRPYFDSLYDHINTYRLSEIDAHSLPFCERAVVWGYRTLREIQLVSPLGEEVEFKRAVLGGASVEDKSRCIVLYASFNKQAVWDEMRYSERLKQIIRELEDEGYCGHVLYRVGGYPLTKKGGIRFVHIPYSFKILSIIEASQMGYENILWLDAAIHPANDLSAVFQKIETEGSYFLTNGNYCDFDYKERLLPDAAVIAAGLEIEELRSFPHIIAGVIGLSFKFQFVHELMDEWLFMTASLYPAITLYPEEFLLSVVRWKLRAPIAAGFVNVCNFRFAVPKRPHHSDKPFWFDKQ